ncbi:AAA family ATPase [Puniceibacterium confluentis]|uniref:AAA family ATPase n=1 Tax=Puniceibacterium confluentis TaxID=1958944 RepID=UPI0011B4D6B5|nr:AAA family ATPase [Puniceibacterium confluentis]
MGFARSAQDQDLYPTARHGRAPPAKDSGIRAAQSSAALRGRFAVELVGPPGSGKTTLARAAAAELERRGIAVRLAVSARPDESPRTFLTARVPRLAKLADAVYRAVRTDPVTSALMRQMPITPPLAALRRRRYLAALAKAGQTAGQADSLLVQDQGYLCAIAGLAIDSGRVDAQALTDALALVALPRIAVRIGVPGDIAGARLGQRHARQGFAARLLERPAADNTRLEEVFDTIGAILEHQGLCLLRVSGRDRDALDAAVSLIVAAVLALWPACRNGDAVP